MATTLQVYFPVYPITFGLPSIFTTGNNVWLVLIFTSVVATTRPWALSSVPKMADSEDYNLTLFYTKFPTQ